MRWLRVLSGLLLVCSIQTGSAFAVDCHSILLQDRLNALLPNRSRWALSVVDLDNGKELICSGNAGNDPLVPGSLVKLITTGAVLDLAGQSGRFNLKTSILCDGVINSGTLQGNLYLLGRGNAFLTAADLRKAAKEMRRLGISRVTGDIVADAGLFEIKGLERSRKGPGYAPPGALGLDQHTVAVVVTPAEAGKPPLVTLEPPVVQGRLAIAALTTTAAANSIQVTQLDDAAYQVTGNINANSVPLTYRFSLRDPALYAAGTFKALLLEEKIQINGEAKKGQTPAGVRLLVEIAAPELHKVLREMNVNSLNLVADNLLLRLGAERFGPPATKAKGVQAVIEFMERLGIPAGAAIVADGSGLSRANKISAVAMASYLYMATKKSWFPAFYATLPRVGKEGTLAAIAFTDERFRAKSGRLEDTYALAGYGVNAQGQRIAFAYMVNDTSVVTMDMEQSGAEVMRFLVTGGSQ